MTITRPVVATFKWPTNAHLIADVAKLGYLDGTVFDATYGEEGGFWKIFRPEKLVTNDLYKDADHHFDYKFLPFKEGSFDTVVFDPTYKLSGTPSLGAFDERYGADRPMRWQDRIQDILDGSVECLRVASKYLLVKCQDQVCSGHVRWQTDLITDTLYAEDRGGVKVDRFDIITTPMAQDAKRRQVHARRNTSQLLVFEKK